MDGTRGTKWWHDATVYQIYPRSFADSNADGIGDLPGIIAKLDYLADLGVSLLWLSPIYASPMIDNGYDIADYQAIAPEFGTLDDFDALVAAAKARGIGIVMDLVVNHTSDRHEWFAASRSSRENPRRDWYVWRDPAPDGGPPSDLRSYFGGSAWAYDEASGQYYLHLFAPEQPDLNWANADMRAAIYAMMRWWLDRGIAGFRMDVIDLIGKDIDRAVIENGPRLHTHLKEMHREALAGREVVTVGEAWSATPETALLFCGEDRDELSMVFHFEHITERWDATYGKFQPKPFELRALKRVIDKWQFALADDGWNSLFWGNHDLPRAVSSFAGIADDGEHRVAAAKMLATVLHLLRGTPYIFQGEELGMTNAGFTHIDQYRDTETLGLYADHLAAGFHPDAFIDGAAQNSRDNARTPMHWSDAAHGGFTTGTPWIAVNANYTKINAAAQVDDPASVFAHYKALCGLRKAHPVIVYGRYEPLLSDHDDVFAYRRTLAADDLVVIANFSASAVRVDVPEGIVGDGKLLIANRPRAAGIPQALALRPFESFAVLRRH